MNDLIIFWGTIRWQDLVDILINSYIVFRLYVLFRGTNVVRVLIGIAFLWFLQKLAGYLGLIITSWAIKGVTAFAALIIIVVFRNEIRSALQVKNLKTILWGVPRKSVETPVEIVVDSAYELARKRIGALIVFPGRENLEEATHSGISWQGLLSREMIISIFWHNGPVHDGAAIIEGDRIKEVGVILPLSRRKDLPPHFGTRHRAAAGLAENTDALIIVVSEERGNVVVAKGAQFKVVRGKEELSKILIEHLGLDEKQEGFLIKGKLELAIAGLVSVVFISGIWFSFTRGLDTMVTLDAAIEYVNWNPKMEVLETSGNTARVNLSASTTLIKSLKPEQVRLKIDLSKAVPGNNKYTITQNNIALPPGVNFIKVEPPSVEVSLDTLSTEELPVQVDWVGKLPAHLILKEAGLTPKTVWITGGTQILKAISTLYTEKVSLDQLDKTGTMTVKLVFNSAGLKIAPEAKDQVIVKYVLEKR